MPAAKPFVDEWLTDCADALTFVIFSSLGVLDFEGIVIDGNLPRDLVQELVAKVQTQITELTPNGVFLPQVVMGNIGVDARAIGGAILPFYVNFSPDTSIMLTASDE